MNANGADRAPVEIPVTTSNSGRVPASLQPLRRPAPNAPFSPPPEIASRFSTFGLSARCTHAARRAAKRASVSGGASSPQ
jgi:hypothetical protein